MANTENRMACGWESVILETNAPWNEKTATRSIPHILQHIGLTLKKTFGKNLKITIVFILYIIMLTTLTLLELIRISDVVIAVFPLLALLIGFLVRDAIKTIRVESLQTWLKTVYKINIPYIESLLALTAFYNGETEYRLAEGGLLIRVETGLIYETPVAGGKVE